MNYVYVLGISKGKIMLAKPFIKWPTFGHEESSDYILGNILQEMLYLGK